MSADRDAAESAARYAAGASSALSPTVRGDDSSLKSIYANVVNVTGTREEIVLLFGIHQAWHSGQKEVAVQLLDRVMLNPYAAKRLNLMLSHVLREFESRYGPLKTEVGQSGPGETLPSSPR